MAFPQKIVVLGDLEPPPFFPGWWFKENPLRFPSGPTFSYAEPWFIADSTELFMFLPHKVTLSTKFSHSLIT